MRDQKAVIGFENELVTVWVTDSSAVGKIENVEIRFDPYITFADFKTNNNTFEKAPLQLSQQSKFWQFRTRIRDGYKEAVNFSGHYCFIKWGCGSPCQSAVIVDARTGIIYEAPFSAYGYDFKADSRLLIVNPPPKESEWVKPGHYYAVCASCYPLVYLWDEESKRFTERKPGYE